MGRSLAEQYKQQERWRRWDEALSRVPVRRGQRVVDLGCGVGPMASRLASLGASYVGVDFDEDLLAAARARCPDATFERGDLRTMAPDDFGPVDGIWSSFLPAYFPDPASLLRRWSNLLTVGGWCALVEVDDLLGHTPLALEHRTAIEAFYDSARRAGRYDFRSGAGLASAVRHAGLRIVSEDVLADDELTFHGAASEDVMTAWRLRLDRMGGLREFLGPRFPTFRREFLKTLASSDHQSIARVVMVVATRES